KKAVMGIVTDSKQLEDAKDPDTSTIFELFSLMATDSEKAELAAKYRAGGMGYGTAKTMLLEKIEQLFGPARAKRKDLEKNQDYVEQVLREGAVKGRKEAEATMKLVREAAGF